MVTNNPSDPVHEEITPGNYPLMLHTLGGFFLPGIPCNITHRVTLQGPPLWQTGGAAQFHVADAPAK
jgi:hypothetical protein